MIKKLLVTVLLVCLTAPAFAKFVPDKRDKLLIQAGMLEQKIRDLTAQQDALLRQIEKLDLEKPDEKNPADSQPVPAVPGE